MSKFALVLVIAVAVAVQGLPASDTDIAAAAAAGNWEEVQRLFAENFKQNSITALSGDIKKLSPPGPGGRVYGESEYTFHTSSNVNGQQDEKSGGHKVINDNGRISEFDFKPKF